MNSFVPIVSLCLLKLLSTMLVPILELFLSSFAPFSSLNNKNDVILWHSCEYIYAISSPFVRIQYPSSPEAPPALLAICGFALVLGALGQPDLWRSTGCQAPVAPRAHHYQPKSQFQLKTFHLKTSFKHSCYRRFKQRKQTRRHLSKVALTIGSKPLTLLLSTISS